MMADSFVLGVSKFVKLRQNEPDVEELIDKCVDAFEAARAELGTIDLADFLPPADHPHHLEVLRELVRIDIEHGWESGTPLSLTDYQQRFPALFDDPKAIQEITFEDYRQRLLAGRLPILADYQRLYGVTTDDWPVPLGSRCVEPTPPEVNVHTDKTVRRETRASPTTPVKVPDYPPEIGDEFLGFHLISELGRGTFCRVFLAKQGSLANRLVALKVGSRLFGEDQKLAQLQHTNVMPIYSVHQSGEVQAVCMPYFGSTTLIDLLRELRKQQTWPASGKDIVSTLQDPRSTVPDVVSPQPPSTTVAPVIEASIDPPETKNYIATLETFQRLSFVESVVWIGARLADGLAHAHERGIVHRDVKPSNVLLTDEGQPMLLDFNLSEDAKTAHLSHPGGTPSYMAPEQLESFLQGNSRFEPRGDVYSLGVVLYELLTGQHPFRHLPGPLRETMPEMLRQRSEVPPSVRSVNKAIPRSVEAILARCLEPDPQQRYPSARALQQDLDRQLQNLPLLHVPEPSLHERLSKWSRRHPRLTSASSVALVAASLILLLAVSLGSLRQQQLHREAIDRFQQFRKEKVLADFVLGLGSDPGSARLTEGIARSRSALGLYGIEHNADWLNSSAVRRLPATERTRLREESADLLWALARAVDRQARSVPEAEQRTRLLEAERLNEQALKLYDDEQMPRALMLQRAGLAEALGRSDEARKARQIAEQLPLSSARDRFQAAIQLREQGRSQEADGLLKEATAMLVEETTRAPEDFLAWFLRANCHELLQQYGEAATCYTVCIALNPNAPECYFNRALVHARQKRWDKAKRDLDLTLDLRDDLPEAYAQRGLALREKSDLVAAERDLTRALELDPKQTRFLFWRASIRQKQGNAEGAKADHEEGLRREPVDAASWIERGIARLPNDPRGALADFDRAIQLDPGSLPAWQNRAHVLSDYLGRNEDALAAMDRVVELRSEFVPGRLGRGVLLARLGKREEAHREVRAALERDTSPLTLYQAANVYALTSRQVAADADEAMPLLARALAGGFGLDVIDQDSDMDPIRRRPDFRRIVQAARELRKEASK